MIHQNARLYRMSGKFWKILNRNIKTKVDESKKVKFTDTINLPRTKFPARLNQQQRTDVEDIIRTVNITFKLNLTYISCCFFLETFKHFVRLAKELS